MTIEQCALAASWAAVRLAEATEHWVEWTLYVQAIGGAAAIVAAFFAWRAFQQSQRSAAAAEAQARHAEAQIVEVQKATSAQLAAAAAQIRPHLRFNEQPEIGFFSDGTAHFSATVTCQGHGDIHNLTLDVSIFLLLHEEIEFQSGDEPFVSFGRAHVPSDMARNPSKTFDFDSGKIDFANHTWREARAFITANWSDEMNYMITEVHAFSGSNLLGEVSSLANMGVLSYTVSAHPVIAA